MRGLSAGKLVSRRRQDLEYGGNSQEGEALGSGLLERHRKQRPSARLSFPTSSKGSRMRTLVSFVIVIAMSTLALAQTLPAPRAVTEPKQIASKPNAQVEKNLSIERLYMTRAIGGTAWSPDGKTIAFISNISGRNNLWLVPAEGGWPAQLAISDQRQAAPAWSPDGKWIAYQSDYDGDEQWDIFLVSPKTGQVVNLTNTREIAEENPAWSPDGRYLAYMVKPKTSSVFEIDVYDMVMRQVRHLTTGTPKDKLNFNPIWSKDGKWIAYTQQQAKATDSNIFIAEVASGKNTVLPLPKGVNSPGGSESAFTRDGSRLLYYHNGPNAPNDVWVYELASGKSRQVTQSLVAGVRSEDMVEPYLVHYPSRDGKWTISAFVYAPYNLPRNGQHPAIVYVHGGPAAQTVNSFNRFVQYVANQGYIVIAPNYRGSTGYGKEFQQANLFDMGGGDLQDVLAAADWIKQTGYLDPKKIALMGGSYGGYMTMMGVTKAPDVWAAGVPIVPFVNYFTEIANEDPVLREMDMATMGDPEKDKDRLRDRSPIFFIDQVKAPLRLLAGGHDTRSAKEE